MPRIALAEPGSNLKLEANLDAVASVSFLTLFQKGAFQSENFHVSYLGIPSLVPTYFLALPIFLKALGTVAPTGLYIFLPKTSKVSCVRSLAPGLITTFSAPLKPMPANFAEAFKLGPTKVKAPINVVPSAPNFNLFLKMAAALSAPVRPSRLSLCVLAKAFCTTLPSGSPKTSPSV